MHWDLLLGERAGKGADDRESGERVVGRAARGPLVGLPQSRPHIGEGQVAIS